MGICVTSPIPLGGQKWQKWQLLYHFSEAASDFDLSHSWITSSRGSLPIPLLQIMSPFGIQKYLVSNLLCVIQCIHFFLSVWTQRFLLKIISHCDHCCDAQTVPDRCSERSLQRDVPFWHVPGLPPVSSVRDILGSYPFSTPGLELSPFPRGSASWKSRTVFANMNQYQSPASHSIKLCLHIVHMTCEWAEP